MPRAKQMSAGRSSRNRFIRSGDRRPRRSEKLPPPLHGLRSACTPKYSRAPQRQVEADEHSSKIKNIALGADRAGVDPVGVGAFIETGVLVLSTKEVSAGAPPLMQRLQRTTKT